MPDFKWFLLAAVFLLLMLVFNELGLVSTKIAWISGGMNWGLLTWWKGKFSMLTGSISRNFLVLRNSSRLSVEIDPSAGALELEVRARDGALLHRWQGTAPASFQVGLSGVKRFRVTARGREFKGTFFLSVGA
ncbi:MAG: hypothetical protein HFF18_02885 [Oscillospiraceae bacterium]|nr:hypothetical protein [Oscillospiraceae bacterium]